MDDQENQFADKGGEALNLEEGDGFSDAPAEIKEDSQPAAGKPEKEMKG